MHLYLLVIGTVCMQKMSSADSPHPSAACNPLHFGAQMDALHVAFTCVGAVFEAIVPTVDAMMPDKAPLIVGAWTGFKALALRVPSGRITSVLGEQVSS